jgi:serine protease
MSFKENHAMSQRTRTLHSAAGFILLAFLAGCGGGGGGGGSTTPAPAPAPTPQPVSKDFTIEVTSIQASQTSTGSTVEIDVSSLSSSGTVEISQ